MVPGTGTVQTPMSWNKVIDYYYRLYLVLPYPVYTVYAYRAKYSNYATCIIYTEPVRTAYCTSTMITAGGAKRFYWRYSITCFYLVHVPGTGTV